MLRVFADMNDATFYTPSLWPSSSDQGTFRATYGALPPSDDLAKVNTDQWLDAANLIISLCRGASVAQYKTPRTLYPGPGNGTLPGYVVGYEKLGKDPECALPTC
jgi:hypothetical protein